MAGPVLYALALALGVLACPGISWADSITITDYAGKEITLPASPVRVISLAPNLTELVFSLQAEGLLAGRSQHCNYPPEAQAIPACGSYFRPDIERIITLKPDLCLGVVDGTPESSFAKLESLGIPVLRLNPSSLPELRTTILTLGRVLGRESKSLDLVREFDNRLADLDTKTAQAVKAAGKRPRVLYQVQEVPVLAAGPGTFSDELVTRAGGANILQGKAKDTSVMWVARAEGRAAYPLLSAENIVLLKPDVIIAAFMYEGVEAPRQPTEHEWAGMQKMFGSSPAAESKRIWLVSPDIMNRATMRSLDALEELFRLFFPAFEQ